MEDKSCVCDCLVSHRCYLRMSLCSPTAVEIVGMVMATDVQTSFEDAISKL